MADELAAGGISGNLAGFLSLYLQVTTLLGSLQRSAHGRTPGN